jgi:hypothetical protein
MDEEKFDKAYAATFTTDEILKRLENLYTALNDEGWYTKANTAYLAIEEIKRLQRESEKK